MGNHLKFARSALTFGVTDSWVLKWHFGKTIKDNEKKEEKRQNPL